MSQKIIIACSCFFHPQVTAIMIVKEGCYCVWRVCLVSMEREIDGSIMLVLSGSITINVGVTTN